MTFLEVSNHAKVVHPGYNGTEGTDPYYNVPLSGEALRYMAATRMAIANDAANVHTLSKNDQLAQWRGVYLPSAVGATTRHYVALDATRKVGPFVAGANVAQEGTYKASVSVLDAGTGKYEGGELVPLTQPLRVRFPTAAGLVSGGVIGLFILDQDDTTGIVRVYNRAADASNRVEAAYAATATPTVTVNRVVATVVTAELAAVNQAVIPTGTQAYIALGLRTTQTAYSVFLNGAKVGTGTLNAAAQALTGTGFGFALEGVNLRAGLLAFEAFSLTA